MGSAMLTGWLKSDYIAQIIILDPQATPPQSDKITLTRNAPDFGAHGEKIDLLILAVKPQILEEVCTEISSFIKAQTAILSIAAGKTIQDIKELFGPNQPILRVMPNTPTAIGKGVSGIYASSDVSQDQKDTAQTLLEPLGLIEWLESEDLMNALTALSGSGPAYVFYMIEMLAKSGEALGFSKETAQKLARQTVIGAANLAEEKPDQSTSTLRQNVTSKGGTTESALEVLMDGRAQDIFDEALKAAQKRSEEL